MHWVKETRLRSGTAPTWPQRDQAVLADGQGPRPGQHVRQGLHDAFHHLQTERWTHHTLHRGFTQKYAQKKTIYTSWLIKSQSFWDSKTSDLLRIPLCFQHPANPTCWSRFFHPLFSFMPAKIFERRLAAFQNLPIHIILLSSSRLWLLLSLNTVTPTLIRSGKFLCSVFMQKRTN